MRCYVCKAKKAKKLYELDGYDVFECENCGIRFSWPPEKHNYEEDYFEKEQKPYFNTCKKGYRVEDSKIKDFKKTLKEIEKFSKKGNILDIGCATGVFLDIAKKRGWKSYGIDISKYATDYARKEFKVNARAGELLSAGYRTNWFDAVTMCFFIEHINNPVEIIKEVKRILKKKGVLFISTINEDSLLNSAADFIYNSSFGIIKQPVKLLHPHQHLTHFSEKDILKILKNNGFEILEKEMMDLPSSNFQGGIFKDIILNIFYLFQKIFKKKYIVWVIARKI